MGRGTHGTLGLSKLGRYPRPHAVPSDPEQVGRWGCQGVCLVLHHVARGQGWSPGSPEISSGMVLGRAGPRSHPAPTQVPVMETHGCEFGWAR